MGSTPQQLGNFLHYVLGRRPDEFGLVPDADGYVPVKDLLKVCAEEPGWRHVRRGQLETLGLLVPSCPVDMTDNRIRAVDRSHLPHPEPVAHPPALLYVAVRRRAHAVVMEKGLRSTDGRPLVLSDDRPLAQRMGSRRDRQPVMLTVHLRKSPWLAATLTRFGDHLYLCPDLPPDCITGPPLPKAETAPDRKATPAPPAEPKTPGSFPLGPDWSPVPASRRRSDKKGKRKPRRQAPPWRS